MCKRVSVDGCVWIIDRQMECFSGDVNRMQCGIGWSGVDWNGMGDGG